MRRPIQILEPKVCLKIAAGEVVERPASVVKELMENSLDAGAKRLEVRIEDGGRRLISVSDDGIGIPADEALLALKTHATSKITTDDDLIRVATYGFRGEALASIAAVSHLDLITRTAGSEHGIRVRTEGGDVKLHEPFGMPFGTTVSVQHLFFNTPARLKFLKSRATEFGHIENAVRKIALARPDITVLLEHSGEIVLHAPAVSDFVSRAKQIYGADTGGKLVEFCSEEGEIQFEGVSSDHHLSFGSAQEIQFFVNGRWIRDRMLQSAVMEGYRSVMMERRYPLLIGYLHIPNELVDVNVHPAKTEVRFADSQTLFRLVSETLKRALIRKAPTMVSWEKFDSRLVTPSFAAESRVAYGSPPAMPLAPLNFDRLDPLLAVLPDKKPLGPFSRLRFLSTLDHTYLLCASEEALIVIDQHAAHERVLFEKLRKNFIGSAPEVQRLLVPLSLELTSTHEASLKRMLPTLQKLGFDVEEFGARTFILTAVPSALERTDLRSLVADLADSFEASGGTGPVDDHIDHILSTMACHSAVRAHDVLRTEEIQSLLTDMDSVDLATNCPHGRPTFLRFAVSDLERLFKRT